jgi:hypothetical protein
MSRSGLFNFENEPISLVHDSNSLFLFKSFQQFKSIIYVYCITIVLYIDKWRSVERRLVEVRTLPVVECVLAVNYKLYCRIHI